MSRKPRSKKVDHVDYLVAQSATQDFDDLRAITNCLRNNCDRHKTLKRAMPTLVEKTGLSEERIRELVKKGFKDYE